MSKVINLLFSWTMPKLIGYGCGYYQAVDYTTREGLFAGTSEKTFSPEQGMTRAMFVSALGRVAGQTGKSGMASCFTDVDPSSWYGPSVEWAAEQQIVS